MNQKTSTTSEASFAARSAANAAGDAKSYGDRTSPSSSVRRPQVAQVQAPALNDGPAADERDERDAEPQSGAELGSGRSLPGIGILLGYLAITFFLTHVRINGTYLDYKNYPGQLQFVDKAYHIISYSVLTFAVLFCFTSRVDGNSQHVRLTSAKQLAAWCLGIVVYGLFDESTQPFFGRSFETLDLLANCVGIACGQLLFVVCEATGVRNRLLDMM